MISGTLFFLTLYNYIQTYVFPHFMAIDPYWAFKKKLLRRLSDVINSWAWKGCHGLRWNALSRWLSAGCRGDPDESWWSGERYVWATAWPTAPSPTCPADRGDYVPGHRNVVSVCACDWIHMCSSSSCNKAVHLQCDSMFSDHGRSWVQGGSPSDASAAAQRNFKHFSHQCISLLQRFYSPQRCVCMCVCVGLSTSKCTWNLFLKLSRGAQWLVVTHFHFLQQAKAQQLEICCLRTIRHPCKITAKSSILFSHTYSSFLLFSF